MKNEHSNVKHAVEIIGKMTFRVIKRSEGQTFASVEY